MHAKEPLFEDNLSVITEQFYVQDDVEKVLSNLNDLYKAIFNSKLSNTKRIYNSKTKDEIVFLFFLRDAYDELLNLLENGILTANIIVEFMRYSNMQTNQKLKLEKENNFLRKSLSKMGNQFIVSHQKYKNLNIHQDTKEIELNHLGFSLYILDEFHFNKESTENSLWNIAVGNNLDEQYRNLPIDLLKVKWFCNQEDDDVSCVQSFAENFHPTNNNIKALVINLGYLAKSFYDCCNFKCASYFIDTIIQLMKVNKLDGQTRFCFYQFCKALLLGRMKQYESGYNLFMESIELIRSKEGIAFEKDFLIACQILNVGCVLTNWGVCEIGVEIVAFAVMMFEDNLPETYSKWEEASILSARFYNDNNEFKKALKIAAPLFDYFHILNFGSIKDTNKPLYELAIELTIGSKVHTVTKNLKYPLFLPKNISILLIEMIISFSGLGDRSSAMILENWMNRCQLLSSSYKYLITENFDYTWYPNVEKVIYKMKLNQTYHEKVFSSGLVERT